jgi:tetratricopeptide (TPR) repeat protein
MKKRALSLVAGLALSMPTASSLPTGGDATTAAAERKQAEEAYRARDWKAVRERYAAIVTREPGNAQALYRLGHAHHSLGEYEPAIAAYTRAVEIGKNATVMYDLACSYALAKKKEDALGWLAKALDARFPQPQRLASDPDLAPLRDDPRFAPLLARAEALAFPCANDPKSREFDFWIGEWDVEDTAGNQVGTSRIESLLGSCVVFENWTSARGGTGKSINVYNKDKAAWQQTWVDDQGGVIEFVDGRLEDGAMRFRAVVKDPAGKPSPRRLTFFDLGPEGVRQFSEMSNDDGKTWSVEYDFLYVRRAGRAQVLDATGPRK